MAAFYFSFGIFVILFCVLSVVRTQGQDNWHGGNVCLLPQRVGPCFAAFQRYYFNTNSGQCEQFIWGGCEPNGNNFETLNACNRRCSGNICELPKKTGPCRGNFKRYYYNSRVGRCLSFVYGGCQGNGNNFNSLRECRRTCGRGGPASYGRR